MADKTNTVAAAIVSVVVVIMVGALIALVIVRPTPLDAWQQHFLDQAGGVSFGAVTTVVGYWLGSSIGSKAKDEMMARRDEQREGESRP